MTTQESVFLHRNGQVLDSRMHEAKDVTRKSSTRKDDQWSASAAAPLATLESLDEPDFVPISKATVTNKSSKAILTSVQNMHQGKTGIVYNDNDADDPIIESGNLDELIHEFVPR